ncbi:MAG: head-tail adaptor protein [Rickettsiaceae bacterium]|nr:head-tail adaptor protein [Rickettsiaceae bacterium]
MMCFKHKITLLENKSVSELEANWQEVRQIYANIKPLCDTRLVTLENVEFGSIISAEYYDFYIRYTQDINIYMRLSFRQNIFEIKRIINHNFSNKFLSIIALQIQ